MPVENVKVRVRRWFTIKTDYTDTRGNYSISHRFKRAVNYSVIFTTPYAKISNWIGSQTTHNGPKRRGTWNVDYNWHSENWVRATLINAAGKYRTQYRRTGIQNPYPTGYWAGGDALNKLNIRAVFKEGTGDMFVIRANRIRVYSKFTRGRGNKETDDLYAVTFHELGHQSHWKLNKWNLTFGQAILAESWANYIEFVFTNQYYPNIADNQQWKDWNHYIWDKSGGESRDEKNRWKYTALFNDLSDNTNQRATNGGSTNFPNDDVSGYSITQLQKSVEKSRKLEHVRDYLRDHYRNSTETNLNDLFEFYINVENTRKQ